jgi:hypothetical protein
MAVDAWWQRGTLWTIGRGGLSGRFAGFPWKRARAAGVGAMACSANHRAQAEKQSRPLASATFLWAIASIEPHSLISVTGF